MESKTRKLLVSMNPKRSNKIKMDSTVFFGRVLINMVPRGWSGNMIPQILVYEFVICFLVGECCNMVLLGFSDNMVPPSG
jgi:hypothetical protein